MSKLEAIQRAICARFGAEFLTSSPRDKLGIADAVTSGAYPLNGLRHPASAGTCGWFIWAGGEPGSEPDFFKPLHVDHVQDRCPEIVPYLGLAPGWRFLLAGDYLDVWFDESLINPQ